MYIARLRPDYSQELQSPSESTKVEYSRPQFLAERADSCTEHSSMQKSLHRQCRSLVESHRKAQSAEGLVKKTILGNGSQYRYLFDQMPNGMFVCELIFDASGMPCDFYFVWGNAAFERLTGLNAKELAGLRCKELDLGWPNEVLEWFYKVATTRESIQYTRYNEILDRHYATSVFSPVYGQFAHVFTDVTTGRHSGAGVQLKSDVPEKSAIEQIAQNRTTNNELEAFSYSVSHDLRAPLRRISGFTHILVEDYASKLDAEGNRLCSVITDNCAKMGHLIDNLLAFSRSGNSEMRHASINMKKLALSSYEEVTDSKSRESIDFQIGELCDAQADENLLRQVWINLLSNAVKYSSKREKAVISVSCKQEPGQCIYCIEDNGAGFNMRDAAKLFLVFRRLHEAKDFEGSGVGLAIVERIIHRHSGMVWAEGEVDNGARFYFSLPLITLLA